jgi:hypothetical protein
VLVLPPIVAWAPTPFTWSTIYAIAGGAGVVMALAGVGGYGLLAFGRRRGALAGLVLGPLLLIGGPLLVGPGIQLIAQDALARGYEHDLSAGSTFIHIDPTTVTAASSNGHVSRIDVTATVTADRWMRVREDDPGDPSIFFAVRRVGTTSPGWGTIDTPTMRVFGDPTAIELNFGIFDSGDDDAPGAWELIMNCIGTDQVAYRVAVPITVPGEG